MIQLLSLIITVNLLFAAFMYMWATDDDISNLPKEPGKRFMALFYFSVTTSTSTGYGDIVPKSIRARAFSVALQLLMFTIVVKRILESV